MNGFCWTCALVFMALALLAPAAMAESLEGRVVGVSDGDTLVLSTGRQQIKIRLAQIDAPEYRQAFGQASKQSLAGMVLNRMVRVELETVDKYGRMVGTVFVGAANVNYEQVRRGMAWAYRQYLHDPYYLQLESEARQAGVGLWSAAKEPPWQYRREHPDSYARRTPQASSFFCAGKQHCKDMSSCDEAMFYLTRCGVSRLDRNHDGVPCESLCNAGR